MNNPKKEAEYTAYCGLFCGDCIPFNRKLFDSAQTLLRELEREQFHRYAELKGARNVSFRMYDTFFEVLSELPRLQCSRPCRSGGGKSDCKIRKCAVGKGLKGCWECQSFEGCVSLRPLRTYHGDIPVNNLKLIRKDGIENWANRRGPHYLWTNKK